MGQLVYRIIISIYGLIILLLAPFNRKAALWISGRRGWAKRLSKALPDRKKIIWMHVSSLGEFEQGRPVLEQIRKQYPNHFILLTFFSPSGYLNMKNTAIVDGKFYLPLDTMHNAAVFCQLVAPELAIFVKYDFWFNMLYQLKQHQIKYMFISAVFRSDQFFFKWYGKWALKIIFNARAIHVQNHGSAQLLENFGYRNTIVSGDPRFDRVIAIANGRKAVEGIKEWIAGRFCLVAGSTWPVDDDMLLEWISLQNQQVCLILAQHQLNVKQFEKKCTRYPSLNWVKWSDGALTRHTFAQILLIDTIGLLSTLYGYGSIAYVGGGFGAGIHNVLEAAVYGVAVVIGPNYKKFDEAVRLKEEGGLTVVNQRTELYVALNQLLYDDQLRNRRGAICSKFVRANQGATSKIMEDISKLLHES